MPFSCAPGIVMATVYSYLAVKWSVYIMAYLTAGDTDLDLERRMAETEVEGVHFSMVLDEPEQSTKKKIDTGSKSPGKGSRRWGKGSLFKRTFSDQDVSQRAERPPSGKSKARKESQEGLSQDSPVSQPLCLALYCVHALNALSLHHTLLCMFKGSQTRPCSYT
jgi:hypothetical protein